MRGWTEKLPLWLALLLIPLVGLAAVLAGDNPRDRRPLDERAQAYADRWVHRAGQPWSLGLLLGGTVALLGAAALRRRLPREVALPAPSLDAPVLSPIQPMDESAAEALRAMFDALGPRLDTVMKFEPPDVQTYLDLVIEAGVRSGASDVHLHPLEDGTHTSLRLHGQIREIHRLRPELHRMLIGRLKVLARVVHHVSDRPQDGHFRQDTAAGPADFRVSFLPTQFGEKVVLRIARTRLELPTIDVLGLEGVVRTQIEQLLAKPQGLIAFTGPVGSGKTTSIYASLGHIHQRASRAIQIATIEDPIEFNVPALSQTQVNAAAGLSFAQGLRALLRQDPNVLMVGEVRDAETAHIAVQAGLTGHLLLTTVHADSAVGVFARLLEMEIEPYVLASAAAGCVSQRLVQGLCPGCRQTAAPTEAERALLAQVPGAAAGSYSVGRGCRACAGTGYRGRMPLVEVLVVTPRLRELIAAKTPTQKLHAQAVADGMVPLLEAGLAAARAGKTSLAEVFRVAQS